jgi:cytochrome P450
VTASDFITAYQSDPHTALAALRGAGPVHRITLPNGVPAWLVARYEEGRAALADARLANGMTRTPQDILPEDVARSVQRSMMHCDPPDHTRLRGLVSAVFTAGRMKALRPRVVAIMDELLDGLAGRSEFDLVEEVALPLPMRVICELLGFRMEDREKVRAWTIAYVTALGSARYPVAEIAAFVEYMRGVLDAKRERPDDGLLSALVAVRDGSDRLSDDEVISMATLLLSAGYETTAGLIGTGMFHLLSRPEVTGRVRTDPEALPAVVEECLRFESPAPTAFPRMAQEDLEIGGVRIAAGEVVLISILSANRDETVFDEAATFDADRERRSMAFGHGVHHCLGAPLARMEGQVAFAALLERFPRLRLTAKPDELHWMPGLFVRGLRSLPVAVE